MADSHQSYIEFRFHSRNRISSVSSDESMPSDQEVAAFLSNTLAQGTGVNGISAHYGERFTIAASSTVTVSPESSSPVPGGDNTASATPLGKKIRLVVVRNLSAVAVIRINDVTNTLLRLPDMGPGAYIVLSDPSASAFTTVSSSVGRFDVDNLDGSNTADVYVAFLYA